MPFVCVYACRERDHGHWRVRGCADGSRNARYQGQAAHLNWRRMLHVRKGVLHLRRQLSVTLEGRRGRSRPVLASYRIEVSRIGRSVEPKPLGPADAQQKVLRLVKVRCGHLQH